MTRQFAVKRGRSLTEFASAEAAYWYWAAVMGSALLIRVRGEIWAPLDAIIPGTGGGSR